MNASHAETIARACYQAYVTKDRAAIEALVAPDFRFTSPLDNALDRAAYLERCWPNSQRTKSFDFVSIAPDGDDRVFVVYEATTLDGKRFRNAERLSVRGEQLIEVEVYFGWSLPHEAKPGTFVDEVGTADDKRQIHELVRQWMEATQQGDATRVLALVADDALFLQPGKPPMDKALFEKQARTQAGAGGPSVDGTSEIEELIVSGDWAIARNRLKVTITPHDGSPASTRTGQALTVFHKENGRWRLARDANLLAPAGAAAG